MPGVGGAPRETTWKEAEIALLFWIWNTYNGRPFYYSNNTPENFFGPYYDEDWFLRIKTQPKEDRDD